ncbi:hypothetical protein BDZ85DRAFT_37836 [Elsinoe ampelina]|uniref:CCHC-type domain-containing protein n=1 Tax=Elsinoe ampelina TaxID=302913 RepID=A0A6A6G343_9PEZI|nr:hypothetical protein BDZ85DRAFT_37836 [Elsinoe ampelina]
MKRHIRLKTASDSLCVFCAHRLAPVTTFVRTPPRTNVRIQRRGLRSSTVYSRAAEAGPSTQQQDDPFDPFGQPLPNQFVNPEEAARANVARLKEQRAEEERIRSEEERIRREERTKKQQELESKSIFHSDPQESIALPSADVSGVRDKHLRLKDARQRTHAAKEQSAAPTTTESTTEGHGPDSVPQQQGRRTPDQRPDGTAGSQDQQEKADQVRIRSTWAGMEGKGRHKARLLADEKDRRESNALFNQPAVTMSRRTTTTDGHSTTTGPDRNSATIGRSLADAVGARRTDRNGRQGDRVQNKLSSREQAIADITENMNMKSMPRLDRERPQRQTNALIRNTKTSAFPVFGEAKPSFPSFGGEAQTDGTVGKDASEWTHSDVPEIPPEIQARIDEEKRLAEERRIEEERRLEEERKVAEARKAEEERLAEERRKDAERKESERRLLEAHRRKIKQEEEARQIAETARLSAQQKEQARQAAEAARLYAQQQAQLASNQSMADIAYGQEVSIQQEGRTSQSAQAGPTTHQPAARDEGLGGLSLSTEELDEMTEEEIDMYFKLLKKKMARRAKAREEAMSSPTNPGTPSAKSEAFGNSSTSTQAASQNLPLRSTPSKDQPTQPQFSEAALEPGRASASDWQPQSAQQVQAGDRGYSPLNVTADDTSMDGMSDLMRQGMLAGAAYRSAPKDQTSDLTGARSSDEQHFQRDTTLDREPPKARSSGSSSPLLPFDPALTSKWNLLKAPGRRSDPPATSPARSSTQFAPRNVEGASGRQNFPQMREGLSAERPADDPFTPVGRYDGPRKETRTCNICGQPGHISFFCPERKAPSTENL